MLWQIVRQNLDNVLFVVRISEKSFFFISKRKYIIHNLMTYIPSIYIGSENKKICLKINLRDSLTEK
jgi:hypothetical protein